MANSKKLWSQLDDYWAVLQDSALAPKSIEDYYYFAECFVRWTEGDFTPGLWVEANQTKPKSNNRHTAKSKD